MKQEPVGLNGDRKIKKTSFTCPDTVFRKAARRAARSQRSMSGYIQFLILEDLKSEEKAAQMKAA